MEENEHYIILQNIVFKDYINFIEKPITIQSVDLAQSLLSYRERLESEIEYINVLLKHVDKLKLDDIVRNTVFVTDEDTIEKIELEMNGENDDMGETFEDDTHYKRYKKIHRLLNPNDPNEDNDEHYEIVQSMMDRVIDDPKEIKKLERDLKSARKN